MSEDKKIIVEESLAREYARIKGVPMEVAYKNLEAQFTREAKGVDLEQRYDALIKAFRTMSPQLNGVIMRESEIAARMKSVENTVAGFQWQINALKERLDFERDVYKQSMIILNGIVEEDKKTIARLVALEARILPLHMKIWNRIKCLLKR